MNENLHARQEDVTLAAGGLVHDMVLLVLSQSSAAPDAVKTAMG